MKHESTSEPPVDYAAELKNLDQWVCYQERERESGKKPKKVPVHPRNPNEPGIDNTNPKNWMPYKVARGYTEANPDITGYGFSVREGDPYAFIDIDKRVDYETGEIPPVAVRLMDRLGSYAYLTPNFGVRIVIKGELQESGGNYVWEDPDTGEKHVFEVYDRKHFLTFTEKVLQDVPIEEAQDFLDSLVKHRSSRTTTNGNGGACRDVRNLPEIELSGELEENRKKIKHLFSKHDLDPFPILAGSRKITLISHFRKIICNQHITYSEDFNPEGEPDELWRLLHQANETMLYDEHGTSLDGLDQGELEEVYRTVTKGLADKSPAEVQEELDELQRFLTKVQPGLSYRRNSMWKTLKALEEHGRKYGTYLPPNRIRVDIGRLALMKQARIGSPKTLSKAIKNLTEMGMITRGWDHGDRTKHFILDLNKVTNPSSWGIEEGFYLQGNKSNVGVVVHSCSLEHKNKLEEFKEALTHSTWYRGVGPSKIKYILAILNLGKEAGKGATAANIAEYVGVKVNSVYAPLNELKEAGIIEKTSHGGTYRVTEDLIDKFYNYRSGKEEFSRDDKAKKDAEYQRVRYGYQKKLTDEIAKILADHPTMPSEHALQKAVAENPAPTKIDRSTLPKIQDWALRGARRRLSKKRYVPKRNGSQSSEPQHHDEHGNAPHNTTKSSYPRDEPYPDDGEQGEWIKNGSEPQNNGTPTTDTLNKGFGREFEEELTPDDPAWWNWIEEDSRNIAGSRKL